MTAPDYEPFDLKRAQAGEPIMLRDGTPCEFIAYRPTANPGTRVIAQIGRKIFGHYEDGSSGNYRANDLVMAPKPKPEVWLWARACRDGRGGVRVAWREGAVQDWSDFGDQWIGPPVRVPVDEDKR